MGVIVRQSIRGTVANYVGAFIGFITTFFVLTDFLTSEEIGLVRVILDTATLFAGLAQLGTSSSLIRYYPYFKDKDTNDHGFFFWSLIVPFFGFLIFGILFWVLNVPVEHYFAKNSLLFVKYYYYIFPIGFFMLYMTVFETYSNVLMNIVVPKIVREIVVRILLLVDYLLYAFRIVDMNEFVIGFCLIYAITTLLNLIYLFSLKKITIKPDFKYITKPIAKDYLLYTAFVTFSTLLAIIIPYINELIITKDMGLVFTGIFTIAMYISSMIEIPYRSLGAISQPHISQAMKDKNIIEANRLCKSVSLHQFIIGSLLFFIIWINIDLFFELLPNGDQYVAGKMVVFILMLSKLFNSTYSVGTTVLNYSKYYYHSLFFSLLLSALAILLNVLLIPIYGMNGAAFATLISYVVYYLLLLLFVRIRIKTSPFSINQLKVLVIVLVIFILDYLWSRFISVPVISHYSGIIMKIGDAVIKTIILTGLCIIILYFNNISVEVNNIINRIFRIKK